MAKRRKEPWEQYEAVHKRLQQWSDWIHFRFEVLGWNVYQGEQEPRLKVQLRNDLHGDKLYQEVANMDRETRRAIETDKAIRELPKIRRDMLWLLYVETKAYPKQEIAHKSGISPSRVADELDKAFISLDSIFAGIRIARSAAA